MCFLGTCIRLPLPMFVQHQLSLFPLLQFLHLFICLLLPFSIGCFMPEIFPLLISPLFFLFVPCLLFCPYTFAKHPLISSHASVPLIVFFHLLFALMRWLQCPMPTAIHLYVLAVVSQFVGLNFSKHFFFNFLTCFAWCRQICWYLHGSLKQRFISLEKWLN